MVLGVRGFLINRRQFNIYITLFLNGLGLPRAYLKARKEIVVFSSWELTQSS